MQTYIGGIVLGALVSTAVHAGQCAMPVTEVGADSASFGTAREAAVAVLTELSSPFARAEWGGVIIERGGRFYATRPVTLGDSTALDFRVRKSASDRIAATYHTHPLPDCGGAPGGNGFSQGDVEVSTRMQVPAYMATEFAQQIRVFDPSAGRRAREGKTLGRYVAALTR